MKQIDKIKKEWEDSELSKRVTSTEMFAINHGFPEWKGQNVSSFLFQSLLEYNEKIKEEQKEKINKKFNGYGGTLGFTKRELIDLLELTDGK